MISLTEAAARQVRQLGSQRQPHERLRVFVEIGGCSGLEYAMGFGPPEPGDVEMESHGVRFLVAGQSIAQLEGSEIHYSGGLMGKGFEVRNPNAKSTCGCGRSFN